MTPRYPLAMPLIVVVAMMCFALSTVSMISFYFWYMQPNFIM